jgi:hypothetical protein
MSSLGAGSAASTTNFLGGFSSSSDDQSSSLLGRSQSDSSSCSSSSSASPLVCTVFSFLAFFSAFLAASALIALFSNSFLTTATISIRAARCRADLPSTSLGEIRAPALMRSHAISSAPARIATCRGVRPTWSLLSTFPSASASPSAKSVDLRRISATSPRSFETMAWKNFSVAPTYTCPPHSPTSIGLKLPEILCRPGFSSMKLVHLTSQWKADLQRADNAAYAMRPRM